MDTTAGRDERSQSLEELRELAGRIQEEMDTNNMIKLVQQLIAKFDESRSKKFV